jgi:hypothetical protein
VPSQTRPTPEAMHIPVAQALCRCHRRACPFLRFPGFAGPLSEAGRSCISRLEPIRKVPAAEGGRDTGKIIREADHLLHSHAQICTENRGETSCQRFTRGIEWRQIEPGSSKTSRRNQTGAQESQDSRALNFFPPLVLRFRCAISSPFSFQAS